jgi:hypothetical protein
VTLHGSGPSSRVAFTGWAGLFAAEGIATLAYDKRGTGTSTGDYRFATLADLADDAGAAVAMLRARNDVDPKRVGLLGTSQGPWLATIIAAKDSAIALLLFSSGGGVGVGEQEIYRRTTIVRDSGFPAPQVDTAGLIVRKYFRYLASGGRDSAGIRELWRRHSASPWFRLITVPGQDPTTGEWPPFRRAFAADIALGDTLARLHARIRQPVFAIFPGDDHLVPSRAAIQHLESELPRGRTGQLTTVVLPGADHGFRLPARAGDIQRAHAEYFPSMVAWLREQFGFPASDQR